MSLPASPPAIAAPARFTAPLQPWRSADRHVSLLRPSTAAPTMSDAPVGALMGKGWRLVWNGAPMLPGRIVVRLSLPVRPADAGEGRATEILQIGVSEDRRAVRSCRTYGLDGGSGGRLPDRIIDGLRFTARANADAGMSQRIRAIDLRAVVAGRCYAVERFTYAIAAGVADDTATLPQAAGASALDAALASLRLAPGTAPLPAPPRVRPGPRAVAR